MFKVRTKDLQKRINLKCIVDVGRKPCKMVVLGSAYGSVMYFRIKGMNHLYSWDTKESFLEENMKIVNSYQYIIFNYIAYNNSNDIILYNSYITCQYQK